jgi:hypothetical protein
MMFTSLLFGLLSLSTFATAEVCDGTGCRCLVVPSYINCDNGHPDSIPLMMKMTASKLNFKNVQDGALDALKLHEWLTLSEINFNEATPYICRWITEQSQSRINMITICDNVTPETLEIIDIETTTAESFSHYVTYDQTQAVTVESEKSEENMNLVPLKMEIIDEASQSITVKAENDHVNVVRDTVTVLDDNDIANASDTALMNATTASSKIQFNVTVTREDITAYITIPLGFLGITAVGLCLRYRFNQTRKLSCDYSVHYGPTHRRYKAKSSPPESLHSSDMNASFHIMPDSPLLSKYLFDPFSFFSLRNYDFYNKMSN